MTPSSNYTIENVRAFVEENIVGFNKSVLRHLRELLHYPFVHSLICCFHSFSLFFLLCLLLACLSSHRLFSIFPDKQRVSRKEKRSFCPYLIHLFQESDEAGVLLPVLNFVKCIISKGKVDRQTAVL